MRVQNHALLTITRADSDWLRDQAYHLATTRPAAATVLIRAFMDACQLAADDTAPLIAAWIRRREARTRSIKYPVAQSVRIAMLDDVDAVARAFRLPGRSAAFELIAYVLRNLDGVSITDDA